MKNFQHVYFPLAAIVQNNSQINEPEIRQAPALNERILWGSEERFQTISLSTSLQQELPSHDLVSTQCSWLPWRKEKRGSTDHPQDVTYLRIYLGLQGNVRSSLSPLVSPQSHIQFRFIDRTGRGGNSFSER